MMTREVFLADAPYVDSLFAFVLPPNHFLEEVPGGLCIRRDTLQTSNGLKNPPSFFLIILFCCPDHKRP